MWKLQQIMQMRILPEGSKYTVARTNSWWLLGSMAYAINKQVNHTNKSAPNADHQNIVHFNSQQTMLDWLLSHPYGTDDVDTSHCTTALVKHGPGPPFSTSNHLAFRLAPFNVDVKTDHISARWELLPITIVIVMAQLIRNGLKNCMNCSTIWLQKITRTMYDKTGGTAAKDGASVSEEVFL